MRMRKKKHSTERLAECEKYLFKPDGVMDDPAAAIGMAGAPVFLEIGEPLNYLFVGLCLLVGSKRVVDVKKKSTYIII